MVDHGFEYRPLPDDYDYDEMSDEELMARVEYGNRLMAEVDAAVGFINSTGSNGHSSELQMAAFLGIFHPEMDDDRRMRLIRDARLKDEEGRRRGRY